MEKRGAWQRFKRPWAWGPLAFLLTAWAFYEFEPLRHRDLTHELPAACAREDSGGYLPGTYATNWEGTNLVVRATEYPNCAEEFKQVSAHVVGDRVLLRIRYHSPSGDSYACHCKKVIVAKLANLEKRDYQVVRISLFPWP